MKKYTVQVRIPEQMVEVEVLALNVSEAKRLTDEQFDGIEHVIMSGWVH